jgi:enolase-phosphatase E1
MKLQGISHVVLDIEGTTCPVSYVAETLFPYAALHLEHYIHLHRNEPIVDKLLASTEKIWIEDSDSSAQALRTQPNSDVSGYLQLLIRQDRKLAELKDLQGLIWAEGYASGALKGPLFSDVATALRRWHQQRIVLAVYSSGSVAAQQLLYGHSNAGDLRSLFSYWFDTRTGAKQEVSSYHTIAHAMGANSSKILFISDSLEECKAADTAGMTVLFSDREGNPRRDGGSFERISTYEALELEP